MSSAASPFASEGAAPKPTLICIGEVASIGEAVHNDGASRGKEDYYKIRFELTGNGAHRNPSGTFLFIPEFFSPHYTPRNEQSKSKKFVFANNIWREEHSSFNLLASPNAKTQRVGLPNLPGLCGSQDKFNEVGQTLQNDYLTVQDPVEYARRVQEVLQSLEGTQVGYILKQQFQETGRLNEKGYPDKIPGKYYEIAGFYYPTEENVEMLQDKVAKFNASEKTYGYHALMTFSTEIPFDAQVATND